MNTDQIKTFLAVAKTRNMTKAAQILFRSQSTITHRVKLLESRLGFALFERNRGQQNVELTLQGIQFVPYAERFLELEGGVQSISENTRTLLTVAGVDSVNTFIFSRLYASFLSEHTDHSLHIFTHHTWEIYDLVESKSVDIGFVNDDYKRDTMSSELIYQEPYVLVHNIPNLRGVARVHPEQLDPASGIYQLWSPTFEQWRGKWWKPGQAAATLNSAALLPAFLESQGHWVIVPASVGNSLKANPQLYLSELAEPPVEKTCFAIIHRHSGSSVQRRGKLFLDYVKGYLARRQTMGRSKATSQV